MAEPELDDLTAVCALPWHIRSVSSTELEQGRKKG